MSDYEFDERSVDSQSVGSLEDFIDDEIQYEEEEDKAKVSESNIIEGKRRSRRPVKYSPVNQILDDSGDGSGWDDDDNDASNHWEEEDSDWEADDDQEDNLSEEEGYSSLEDF